VLASLNGLLVEGVGDIVEGVDVVLLNGAHWVGLGTEKTVLHIAVQSLSGSGGKEGLDNSVGLDVVEGEKRSGFADLERDELLVGRHASPQFEAVLFDGGGFRELVLG